MFQFPGFAYLTVYYIFNIVGCPIRIPADQFVCANPRSFSQLIASFFASESLGIPHTLLCSLSCFCLINEFAAPAPLARPSGNCGACRHAPVFYVSFFQYVNEPFHHLPPEGESTQSYPVPPIWGGQVGIVENIGVEPMTSCVQGRRSSQLS